MRLRGFKNSEGGLASLEITAEDVKDKAFINQLINQRLICIEVMRNPYLRVKIMPDLESMNKPDPKAKYKDKSPEDLLDMAARRGYEDVPRDAVRDDLITLIAAHDDGDTDGAKKMEKSIRRNIKPDTHKVVGEVSHSTGKATTRNETRQG